MSTPALRLSWFDRAMLRTAPAWQLRRLRNRLAADMFVRHYEGAGVGRRQSGWRRTSADANAAVGPYLQRMRENARETVRNNPYAESVLSIIANQTCGTGIVAKPNPMNETVAAAWKAWAETTDCDADARHDFYGLQKLVMRTIVESGEVLVRRRTRLPQDGFTVPVQLQVLDPDFLDTSRDTFLTPSSNGNVIIQGVEFDAIGRRVAYWLFPQHPGSMATGYAPSQRVPAESVLHIFKALRPGQVRGISWFASVMLRLKDFDEFEDATLMKQKIAACLAVIKTGVGSSNPLGTVDPNKPTWDQLEPGAILDGGEGNVEVVQPPRVNEYPDYARNVLRAVATGLGVTYEDLTGDYNELSFSAARASRLVQNDRIHDCRWRILIPQFCDPAWQWCMQAAAIANVIRGMKLPAAKWTPPAFAMVDPAAEGLAEMRNVRAGLKSLYEMIRERGYDPDEVFAEIAAGNKKLDELGIVLDSDPRKMTQAGQAQSAITPATAAADAAASTASTGRILKAVNQ